MAPVIDVERCTGCGLCVEYCPGDVLSMDGGVAVATYSDECWDCGACVLECPEGVVEIALPYAML